MTERIIWRRLDLPGHEDATLTLHRDGPELSGAAIFLYDGEPCALRYRILCDPGWRTRLVGIEGHVGRRGVDLAVASDERGRWVLNGREIPSLDGCLDVDLGFSPSTNLLPIRRLELGVGDEAEVTAAWLPFPDLIPQPISQRYRREAEASYRYESGEGRFTRVLDVNDAGFVTRYPGVWIEERGTTGAGQ